MDNRIYPPMRSQSVITSNIKSVKNYPNTTNKFSNHLQSAIQTKDKLIISKHANERLQQRGITINDVRWKQIQEKVKQAKKMGVNDSLVLLNDAALIVNAKNNTVITVMNREEASTQIFTNINGTIVLE